MNKGLPLKTRSESVNLTSPLMLKVVTLTDFVASGVCGAEYCLLIDLDVGDLGEILKLNWGAIIVLNNPALSLETKIPVIFDLSRSDVLSTRDVISISKNRIDVLNRHKSNSNILFVTARCNHGCIMCSQPPSSKNDEWRISECHKLIDLIDKDQAILGISGGEPTLIGAELVDLIRHCKISLPNTGLHILSNGVAFSDKDFSKKISETEHNNLIFGIPIYGSTPQQHDFHTQSLGSFNKTVHGLYNLNLLGQYIELRVVLTKMVLKNINEISNFIVRNLSFVNSVALMGVEPTGYARKNHEVVWEELDNYRNDIIRSVKYLRAASVAVLLYNIPLCKLPHELHDIAIQSISDWKNVFAAECKGCSKIDRCAGFFNSRDAVFVQQNVMPFEEAL